jgi:hypothetical protein
MLPSPDNTKPGEALLGRMHHWKREGLTPHFFGLGFVQLKINDQERWHFYHPDLPSFMGAEEVHNHRYDFVSTIVAGSLVNECFAFHVDAQGPFRKEWESCNAAVPAPVTSPTFGRLESLKITTYTAGQQYQMHHDVLHRVHSPYGCITRLHRTPYAKEFAAVVRARYATKTCPFSQPLSSEECWSRMQEIVEDLLHHS